MKNKEGLNLKKLRRFHRKMAWFDRKDRLQSAWAVLTGKVIIVSIPHKTESGYKEVFIKKRGDK